MVEFLFRYLLILKWNEILLSFLGCVFYFCMDGYHTQFIFIVKFTHQVCNCSTKCEWIPCALDKIFHIVKLDSLLFFPQIVLNPERKPFSPSHFINSHPGWITGWKWILCKTSTTDIFLFHKNKFYTFEREKVSFTETYRRLLQRMICRHSSAQWFYVQHLVISTHKQTVNIISEWCKSFRKSTSALRGN